MQRNREKFEKETFLSCYRIDCRKAVLILQSVLLGISNSQTVTEDEQNNILTVCVIHVFIQNEFRSQVSQNLCFSTKYRFDSLNGNGNVCQCHQLTFVYGFIQKVFIVNVTELFFDL
jgi:hypothetical protein